MIDMEKVEILLGGLNCANCARKIEEKTRNQKEIKNANLNFIKRTMKIEINDDADKDETIKKVVEIIDTTEPGLDIKVLNKAEKPNFEAPNQGGGCITGG